MPTRLKWETTITQVVEKELTVGGRKSADGKTELFTEKMGWYIYIGSVSIFAGLDKPDFEPGDRIEVTLQKKEPSSEDQGSSR